LARRISLLDDGVLTFDISKLPKPFLKGSNPSPGLLQSCRDKRQITYPPGPSGLLRHHRGWHSRKPVKVTTKFRRYIMFSPDPSTSFSQRDAWRQFIRITLASAAGASNASRGPLKREVRPVHRSDAEFTALCVSRSSPIAPKNLPAGLRGW
jgi:hypothetical protein